MLSLKKLKKSLDSLLKTDDNDHTKHLHDALDNALDDPSSSLNSWIADKISDPRVRPDHLTRAIERPGYASRTAREAFQNPNITTEHVNFGLSHPSREIQQTTFTHAPLTEEQVSKEWDHPRNQEWGHKHNIALGLFNNPRAKIPSKVFDFIRNENAVPKLVHASMSHTNTPVEHARWGLHPANSFHVNEAALEHPGLEPADLERFLHRNPQIQGYDASGEAALKHPNLTKEQLDRVAGTSGHLVHAAVINPKADEHTLSAALKNANSDSAIRAIFNHPKATQEMFDDSLNTMTDNKKYSVLDYGSKFLQPRHVQALIDAKDTKSLGYLRANHPAITPEHIQQMHNSGDAKLAYDIVSASKHITPEIVNDYLTKPKYYLALHRFLNIGGLEKLTPEQMQLAATHPNPDVQEDVMRHPNADEDIIRNGLKSTNSRVREAAMENPLGQRLWLEQNPDKHHVKVKFDTGKLRQVRDLVQEHGGSVPKKQLESMGYNLQSLGLNTALDSKGNLNLSKVNDLIQNRPEHKFGYSFEKWEGDQRHSKSNSNVFQLNLTPEILKDINNHGLNDTFNKIQNISKNSSHPIKNHTIGWARYTRGKDGVMIDEIQSDLGQGLVKQIKNLKEQGKSVDIEPEKVEELNRIIFKGKHPSELIHEAFLQAMRDRGRTGEDVHIWTKEPKAQISGLERKKELPGHFIEGYEKIPKKLGYTPGTYGELSTQKNKQLHGSQTWKHKLRKSLPHDDGKFHASMVAVFVGPEILFIRRDDSGLLTRPGGHAEPGEDTLSAAVRELNEEVGIVASPEQLKFVGSKETPRHGGGATVVSVFKLDLPSKPELDYSKDPDQEASSCVWSQPSLIKESEMHHKPDVVVELLKPKSLKQLKKSVEDLNKVEIHSSNIGAATHLGQVDPEKRGGEFVGVKKINGHDVHHYHNHEDDEDYFIVKKQITPSYSKTVGSLTTGYNPEQDKDGYDIGGYRTQHSFVDHFHRGQGIGRALYLAAIQHHGELRSDVSLSPHSDKMWRQLKKNPKLKVKIAPKGERDTQHVASVIKNKKQLKKTENKAKQGWLVKIEGEEGYHPLKDIKDLGYNQGNNYVLHDGREIHQSHIEDMIPSNEEKLKKYIPDMPPPQAEVREVEPPIVTHPTIRFYKGPNMSVVKNVISQIESSGGKFREHPEVKVGVHAGTKAHSSYGLMPKLMQELAQKKKDFAKTPTGLKILASGSPEEVSNITADKKHDDEAMRHLWEYNQSRIKKFAPKGADLELLGAYAHRRGIKGTYDALQNGGLEAIHKDPYVSKFQQLRNKIKSMGKSLESDVIPGGLSDKKSDKDFDPKLVREGVKVELEHTSDPKIAKEIAQDHISESPSYYKMLRKLESMMKSKFENNTHYPTIDGENHPLRHDLYAIKVDNDLAWTLKPEHAARMDSNLARDVKDYSAYLTSDKKKLLNDLHNIVKNDPNRHVIKNTGNNPAMRQRHFHSALRAKDGYSLNFDNGITISANRHSNSNKANNQKDSWHFDGIGLKFINSEPISKSMGENNENTKRNRSRTGASHEELPRTNRSGLASTGRRLSRDGGDVLISGRVHNGGGSKTDGGRVFQQESSGVLGTPGKLQSAKQLKKSIEVLEKNNDYKMTHTAPANTDASLHDLNTTFPDIYTHPHYYTEGRPYDKESISVIHGSKDKPEAKVRIYRAVPKHVNDINASDWISTSKSYAKDHGSKVMDGNYKILTKIVKAKDLKTDGNSIHEWGYHPSDSQPLNKGMNGDWQKEGYKISHVSYPEAPHIIHVKAHKDGQLVGELHAKKRGDTAYSDLVHVDKNHRRKGIASAMYAHAEKNFNVKMTPAGEEDQTEAGKKLWEGTRSTKPFGKSDNLNKALEIPQAMANTTADGLIYRPQTKYVRIKSEVAGTHPKTGQQLYHHVLKQVGHSGETKYHHILSTDTDGKNGIGALEASHMYYDNAPAIERSGVKQEHRGIGLGKMLYQKALEHHGKLKSDYSMSPSANSVWKKLGNTEGIDVKFGKEGTMEPHTAKLNKAEDEHGMTKYDLGDGYSLHHTDRRYSANEDGNSYGPSDTVSQPGSQNWVVKHQGGPVGHIMVAMEKYDKNNPNTMKVLLSGIAKNHRGKGVGGKVYQKLVNHYGALMSDDTAVSDEAQSVWQKIGAKELPDLTTFQDPRYVKHGRGGQIKFNEELQKDVGRIKFNLPNDKREFNKIPDRPDQEVKNVQTPKQVELGLRQAAYPDRKAFSNNTTKAAIKMAYTTLNPEKGQVKGVNVPSTLGTGKAMSLGEHHPVTAEHEGFHYLMHQIRNRHGHEAGSRFINSALAMVHPEDLHSITGMLSGGVYKDDEYLPEEKLAHIRDVLTDKNTRDVFHAHHMEKYINGESPVGIQEATNRLKASWKAIRNMAKEVRPEHLENEDKMRMLANKHMPVYR